MRPLYRQKMFTHVLDQLSGRATSTKNQEAYLVVLSSVLQYAPKDVIFSHLKPLIPMLFKSLESSDAILKCLTLDTLYLIFVENSELVASHLSLLIKSLLRLSTHTTEADIKVRIAALNTLTICSSLPYDSLFPHLENVTRSLRTCLDDPKRLVRKQAAICRNNWFHLEQK